MSATPRPRISFSAAARAFRCCNPERGLQVAALNSAPINAFEALYLATLGGAEALRLEDRIGSLQVGREADIVVLNPKATPLLAFRESRSRSLEENLFVLMTLGDDRSVRATYVAGLLTHAREPVDG